MRACDHWTQATRSSQRTDSVNPILCYIVVRKSWFSYVVCVGRSFEITFQNKKITNFSIIFCVSICMSLQLVVSFVAEVVDAQKQQILGLTVKKEMPMLDGHREPSPVEINDSNSTIWGRGVSWGSTWKARWSENNRRRYKVIYIYNYLHTYIYIYYLFIYIYENYCVCFYVGCVCLCFLFDSYFVTLVD